MIDIGLSKMALVGAVALIVIGPEKLPRVARTVGTLLGKAQRYVADVKAEVNRSMELDELRKMKEQVEGAARDVEQSIQAEARSFERRNHEPAAPPGVRPRTPGPPSRRPRPSPDRAQRCGAVAVEDLPSEPRGRRPRAPGRKGRTRTRTRNPEPNLDLESSAITRRI